MDVITKNSILVVDDEKSNLIFLSEVLGDEYSIYTAGDGQSAIEKATEFLPDLILIDIMMPDINGYDVLAALKESEKTCDIPIIFITGLNNAEDEEKGLSLGAVDYINKPFKATIVKLRVRNQIQIINQMRTIKRLSVTNALINITNRHKFDYSLYMEWKKAIKEELPLSILILDIDEFERYNDAYGNIQGDNALGVFIQILLNTISHTNYFAARWNGGEFAALLSNINIDMAMEIAEKIRENVENVHIACSDGSITQITVSIGVNSQSPKQDSSMDSFISFAENALQLAKKSGKNRVCKSD